MEQLEEGINQDTPVWAIFGDLMAGLVGVFVLLLVWTLGIKLSWHNPWKMKFKNVRQKSNVESLWNRHLPTPWLPGGLPYKTAKLVSAAASCSH